MKYKFIDEHNVKPFKEGFVVLNGKIYTNPSDDLLKQVNVKEMVVLEKPEYNVDTQYLIERYSNDRDVITQSWEIKEYEEIMIE